MMSWMHEQHAYATYIAIYSRTDLNKADMSTESHGVQTIQANNLCLVRFKTNPIKGSKHHELLYIGKYNIGTHRGSSLLAPGNVIYKAKAE